MFDDINTPELLTQAKAGDKLSFDTAVLRNMGLVRAIASHFRDRGTEYEDLVQIGSIGLMKAVRNFDTDAGTRFSTYAVPLITGEIKKHLRDDGIIKISREIKRDSLAVSRAREAFIKENGYEPRISELAEKCGINEEQVVQACEASAPMLSIYGQDDEAGLENLIGADNIVGLSEKISLRQALGKLCQRDKSLILLRYFKGLSQKETGERLGMTQVMVSRREKKIMELLRAELL